MANYSLIVCKVVRGPFVGTNLVSEIFKSAKKLGLYAFSFFFGMFLQSPAFFIRRQGNSNLKLISRVDSLTALQFKFTLCLLFEILYTE